jgi:hypothetical protein
MNELVDPAWSSDWLWSVPLIALTVTFHVWFMRHAYEAVLKIYRTRRSEGRRASLLAGGLMIAFTSLATLAHGIEGTFWALAYLGVGALTNTRAAMLYSFNAITSFGHTNIGLADHWQLMGALEALNGILLFGVSTAFLFRLIGQFEIAGDDRGRDR